jgi:integrase
MTTRPLLPSEIALLERALAERGQHRDRLFLLLAVSTGFRVSELLTLRIGQLLDPRGGVARELTIERQDLKNGRSAAHKRFTRSRRVVLCPVARQAIEDHLATLNCPPPGEAPVFRSKKGEGQAIRRCQAHHVLKKIAGEVGIDPTRIGCHSARKAYARGLYAASGNDLLMTQRLLGHTSPLTTAAYLESSQEELDELALGFDPLAPTRPAPSRSALVALNPAAA